MTAGDIRGPRRVVITGMGTVNPLGSRVAEFWDGLRAGRSGIGPITHFDPSPFPVRFGGEVKNFDPSAVIDARTARRMDRVSQLAVVAAAEAIADAGLNLDVGDPFQRGVILGCSVGGMAEFSANHGAFLRGGHRRVSPLFIPKMMPNAPPASLAIQFGFMGPSAAVSTACSSAADAIGDAFRTIQRGEADVMLTGGTDAAITPIRLAGFVAARALSTHNDAPQTASRPFDLNRDGFVVSEGAGILVLEELEHAQRRGARIFAELLGHGRTNDAYGIAAPHPEARGATRAIANALRDAAVNPNQVDYLNAHATSTPLGDEVETRAIKQALGDHARRLPVSGIKGMTGHLCGASGAVELIATTLALVHGVIPPTINYETPDPACDLDCVPNTARELPIRIAASTSFGFGGHNACLVVGGLA